MFRIIPCVGFGGERRGKEKNVRGEEKEQPLQYHSMILDLDLDLVTTYYHHKGVVHSLTPL